MPAKNPRINVTLEAQTAALLASLAAQEEKTVSGLAKELIKEALERREDQVLSSIATTRDTRQAKRIKHQDVW